MAPAVSVGSSEKAMSPVASSSFSAIHSTKGSACPPCSSSAQSPCQPPSRHAA